MPIPTITEGQHELISSTAFGVAYSRTFSDIPYSAVIMEAVRNLSKAELTVNDVRMYRDLAPYFEARFLALSKAIEATGVKNILEIASGLGPRGYLFAADPEITYLETDLPEMVDAKVRVLNRLPRREESGGVHRITPLNALDEDGFRRIVALFPPGPLVIANEGLLAYLTFAEKAAMARIVHSILRNRGGVWITPDLNTQDNIDRLVGARSQEAMKDLKVQTGRDYVANAFACREDVEKFYQDLGFSTSCRTIGEVAGPLESLALVDLEPEKVEAQTSVLLWEFRAA